MIKALPYAIGFLWLTFSCEPVWDEPFERFTISKGKHYATYRAELLQSNVLTFYAHFDETAIYKTKTEENQYDINKLFGFSDANSHHHEHSARFGWRYVRDSIEIFAYSYVDGERFSEYLGSTQPAVENYYQLQLTDDKYIYTFNETTYEETRLNSETEGVYYLLFPYFGGNETAPQDINVYIKRVY